MQRKTNATDRHPIPTAHSGRTHQEKFCALLGAGYAEVGSKARHLEHEFSHLDAESTVTSGAKRHDRQASREPTR